MAAQITNRSNPAYPRIYRMSTGWKIVLVTMGCVLGLAGIAGLAFMVHLLPNAATPGIICIGLCSAAFIGLGIYAVCSAVVYRVVLSAEGVQTIEPFRRGDLKWAQIRGRRAIRAQHGPATITLIPKDETARKVKIPLMVARDSTFDERLNALPDLDQQEAAESEKQLADSLYQNLTPAERSSRIEQLRARAKWLTAATVLITVAGFVVPDYRHLVTVVLAVMPWVAIGLVSHYQPLYRFAGKRNDPHPDFTNLLIAPGFVLSVRSIVEFNTLDWKPLVMLAVTGGFLLTAAAVLVDPQLRHRVWSVFFLWVFASAYGHGVGIRFDVLADKSIPTLYQTQVVGKHVTRGKSTTWYLSLAPWGPVQNVNDVRVSAARYRSTAQGEAVCLNLGPGALKIPWYQLRDCPKT